MTEEQPFYKPRGKRGLGSTQKQFKFYADPDVVAWLERQPNRTRYINGLIREDMENSGFTEKNDI